jgi:hypothetical protein
MNYLALVDRLSVKMTASGKQQAAGKAISFNSFPRFLWTFITGGLPLIHRHSVPFATTLAISTSTFRSYILRLLKSLEFVRSAIVNLCLGK